MQHDGPGSGGQQAPVGAGEPLVLPDVAPGEPDELDDVAPPEEFGEPDEDEDE